LKAEERNNKVAILQHPSLSILLSHKTCA